MELFDRVLSSIRAVRRTMSVTERYARLVRLDVIAAKCEFVSSDLPQPQNKYRAISDQPQPTPCVVCVVLRHKFSQSCTHGTNLRLKQVEKV